MTVARLDPRKTPRQTRAIATRDTILEAAAQLLGRGGLAAFNTNAVAARAGVSVGSIYQYFPNKDALMLALIHRQQAGQIETLRLAVAAVAGADLEKADLEKTVRTLVRAAMQHHRDNSLLASAIDHEEARLPIDDVLSDYLARGGALAAVRLDAFAGEIAAIDPGHFARTIPAIVRAVVDAWANLPVPQLQTAENEAVRAVIGYLRQPAV